MRPALFLLSLLALPLAAWPAPAQDAGGVRIYRCTDTAGRQSLRDTPCPPGQAQQAREMLRPKDGPSALRAPAPVVASPVPAPQVILLAPPQPMYECVAPDGARYTSADGSGNPRWVPFWTLGYPSWGPGRTDAGRGSFRPAPSGNSSVGRPQQPMPQPAPPPASGHRGPWTAASGGGTWVSDACAMLPPAETCARLRDRRDAIRRRAFNAMPSERDVLRREERTIVARLDNDCGVR